MARVLAGMVTVRAENRRLVTFGPGDEVPGWAAKLITNPRVWVDDGQPDPEPTVEVEPEPEVEETVTYAGRTVAELRNEIATRNEDRDPGDRIPADGIKTELVAALEADDQP